MIRLRNIVVGVSAFVVPALTPAVLTLDANGKIGLHTILICIQAGLVGLVSFLWKSEGHTDQPPISSSLVIGSSQGILPVDVSVKTDVGTTKENANG